MVGIDLGEELLKPGLWYYESCSSEGCLQLCFVQLSILITIYTLEQMPKLSLCLLDEGTEF